MHRYIIAIGDPRNPADTNRINEVRRLLQTSGNGWHSAMDEPGCYAGYFDTPRPTESPVRLHDNCGVVFGSFFDASNGDKSRSPERLLSLRRSRSEDIVSSEGRSLIARYWGYYVAVIRHQQNKVTVIRAPVSPLACLHLCLGSFSLFFSSLADVTALRLTPLSVDWDSINAQVVGRQYFTHETAIAEITSLDCGEAIDCTSSGCTKRVLWDPRLISRKKAIDNFDHASQAMRRAVDFSVNALSSNHTSILVSLSGGLDSSIIASSLARAPHKPVLTGVNYHSRGCGDERHFARAVSESMRFPLIEYLRNEQLDMRRFLSCNVSAQPPLNFSAPDVEARNAQLARDRKATAIFDGELGDNLFGRVPDAGVLVECVRRTGIGRTFLSLAIDYSKLRKQSFWKTLALTRGEHLSIANDPDLDVFASIHLRYGVEGARTRSLASIDAEEHHRDMAERYVHPWFKGARDMAPGSNGLLFGLVTVGSALHHSPFEMPEDAQQVSGLVSQPLAEVALGIPSYFHCQFARDRAVARAAFADALPPTIIHRTAGKGGPESWAKDVVDNNIDFLRSFLLDGILVRRGLIDRTKLEAALSPRIAKSTAIIGDIFAKLYIEAWLANFSSIATASLSPSTSF